MKTLLLLTSIVIFSVLMLVKPFAENQQVKKELKTANSQQRIQEQIDLGEHLVLISACHDCHTPKKMTDKGMEMDYSRALSGHPAKLPPPAIDRKLLESKGLIVTQTLTAWAGPWGISYAANLTSDATGIGNWTEKHFITAIRQGKHKGLESSRMLLPPMPWDMYRNMTDEELKAVFAYLKSTKPIKNVVPAPQPPLAAASGK
ncbi:c-type cytochrome [Pontibacter sp. KCTC 32443]|uniref:c-type cytochrome n=1 Tax=Pontibacter TaxID=323449 RepID=UPI00164ED12C|nr:MULTISPECIES: c-type cytochrome [Pontibacter]MBC5773683.1 c-type cytochrome [Pontibacter sp. KCTC 32443]